MLFSVSDILGAFNPGLNQSSDGFFAITLVDHVLKVCHGILAVLENSGLGVHCVFGLGLGALSGVYH